MVKSKGTWITPKVTLEEANLLLLTKENVVIHLNQIFAIFNDVLN